MGEALSCKLFILFSIFVCSIYSSHLYDFGEDHGDQEIPFSSDPHGITLDIPVIYFEESQNELFIYSSGFISFGRPVEDPENGSLDSKPTSSIAIFYVPTAAGSVYYRATSSDTDLLNELTKDIRRNFPHRDSSDFTALHAIVLTWNQMKASTSTSESNQYQMVIVTDGISSYVFFIYEQIQWTFSNGQFAQAGMHFSDGRQQNMVNSGSDSIRELVNLSNNQKEGTHIFRISGSLPEDPRGAVDNDEYSYSEYDQEEYDNDENRREHQNSLSNCPPDPYRYRCPPECQILTDDRGCSLCVCTQLSQTGHELNANHVDNSENQHADHANNLNQEKHEKSDNRESNYIDQEDDQSNEHLQQSKHAGPADDHENNHQPAIGEGVSLSQKGDSHSPDDPDSELPLSCAAASETIQPCHRNAECVDYNPGYCCKCLSDFYGNGLECLKSGEPQRINGAFEGAINGKELSRTELHTYLITSEGRAYTALSQIPPDVGRSLLLLDPIGGAMGWLFAKVLSPSSYNGFQLTGGLFNRTVNVHIGDRNAVTIRQQFSGRDIYHYFKAQMFITGTLPAISENADITYSDHEDEYKREGPGFVRSYSTYNVVVKEGKKKNTLKLTVDQQIHYNECPYKEFDKDQLVIVRIIRPHVVYDSEERIVRYASTNHITNQRNPPDYSDDSQQSEIQTHYHQTKVEDEQPTEQKNLCQTTQHICTLPNMFCTPVDHSYRCECERGFHVELNSTVLLGWICVDMDECVRGDHSCDRNADCENTIGSYKCTCKDGFVGDGYNCISQKEDDESDRKSDTEKSSSGCHSHQECHQWGECVFGKDGQPGYCKCRGWYTGDGVHHCGPPGEEPKPPVEVDCGSMRCDSNAECNVLTSGEKECVCKVGFHGDGRSCASFSSSPTTMPPHASEVICRSHSECGSNGNCVYSNELRYYRCVCVPPYIGNGVVCELDRSAVLTTPAVSCDIQNNCDENGDCVFEKGPHGEGYHRCRCRPGFTGDGIQCTKTSLDHSSLVPLETEQCNILHNCGTNAECEHDGYNNRYYCRCTEGFEGDGYNCVKASRQTNAETSLEVKKCREASDCHQNAHCVVPEQSSEYVCECLPGYKGDGVSQCIHAEECSPADSQACHQNAECVYGLNEGVYVCKCLDGFTGDGRNCEPIARARSCNEDASRCHANAQCVFNHEQNQHVCICKPGSIGDGYVDCQLDDSPKCTQCSANAQCLKSESGSWQCVCSHGYQGNGQICTPISSCLDDRSLCDKHAECVPGEFGYYVCNCIYGYHGNGRNCSADSETRKESLLIGRGMMILHRSINADEPGKQLIIVPHQIAVGIDFDCQDEKIIWSDIAGHSIRTANFNGTSEANLFESILQSPEGIAVDPSSKNVYYVDSTKNEIGVATLDGKYQKTLINEGLTNPRALAIDIKNKHLYYTDWHRENPFIGRVDLDGANNMQFINSEIHLPNGLAIIDEREEICWVDAGMQRLSCANFNGRNRRVVFAPLEYPFGLTVLNNNRFYWTDWRDQNIHTVSIYGDGYSSFPATIGGSGRLYGIVAVSPTCKTVTTLCANNNGGCEYICLPNVQGVKCVCPDNFEGVPGCG